MRRKSCLWLGAALLAVSGLPPFAHAEVRPVELVRPVPSLAYGYGRPGTFVQLETAFWFGEGADKGDRVTVSPILKVAQGVGHNEAELYLPMVFHNRAGFAVTNPAEDADLTTFRMGNPYAAYFWTWRTLPQQLRLGVGVTAPLALLRDSDPNETFVDVDALGHAAMLRGWKNLWLWAPEAVSAVLHFDYFMRHHFGLVWGLNLDVAPMYYTSDEALLPDEGLQLAAQAELELAWELSWARFVLRASYVQLPLSDLDDKDQIAVEPELRFRFGDADLFFKFTVPIDEPAGFAFDSGKVWGAHIGLSSGTHRNLPKPE